MESAFSVLRRLLCDYRPWITEVFLATLGCNGERGCQVEIGFGDTTTLAFQATTLADAIFAAERWANENKPSGVGERR